MLYYSYRPYKEYHQHVRAHQMFKHDYICDEFGTPCFVCDRLWYNSSLQKIPTNAHSLIQQEFSLDENFDVRWLQIITNFSYYLNSYSSI